MVLEIIRRNGNKMYLNMFQLQKENLATSTVLYKPNSSILYDVM